MLRKRLLNDFDGEEKTDSGHSVHPDAVAQIPLDDELSLQHDFSLLVNPGVELDQNVQRQNYPRNEMIRVIVNYVAETQLEAQLQWKYEHLRQDYRQD